MYRLTASLLNSWLYAVKPDACGNEYEKFLQALHREKTEKTQAMLVGIAFEEDIANLAAWMETNEGKTPEQNCRPDDSHAIMNFASVVKKGSYQVEGSKNKTIYGLPIELYGICDFLKAGVIYDIKRVQRYEYGKYQSSAQHPMYMELFPDAMKFRYLIYDGEYCYDETYRRGEYQPIEQTAEAFLRYLDNAGLMDVYKEKWEVQ